MRISRLTPFSTCAICISIWLIIKRTRVIWNIILFGNRIIINFTFIHIATWRKIQVLVFVKYLIGWWIVNGIIIVVVIGCVFMV